MAGCSTSLEPLWRENLLSPPCASSLPGLMTARGSLTLRGRPRRSFCRAALEAGGEKQVVTSGEGEVKVHNEGAERVWKRAAEGNGAVLDSSSSQGLLAPSENAALERRALEGLAEVLLRVGERAAVRGMGVARRSFEGELFSLTLPLVGGLLVLSLALEDWKSAQEERAHSNWKAYAAFMVAFLCDLSDGLAHAVVGIDLLEEKLGFGVDLADSVIEFVEYFGLAAALVSTVAAVTGEVLTKKDSPQALKGAKCKV